MKIQAKLNPKIAFEKPKPMMKPNYSNSEFLSIYLKIKTADNSDRSTTSYMKQCKLYTLVV